MIMIFRKFIDHALILSFLSFLIFFSFLTNAFAQEINWIEVDKTSIGIQSIDPDSIKYNSKGFLSVMTKYDEINQDDQTVMSTNSYLMAIDCENRLFSNISANGKGHEVKNWVEPINNKLIKKTIVSSCSF